MGRTVRSEVFDPQEIAIAHVIQRCVRRCFLMGCDPVAGSDRLNPGRLSVIRRRLSDISWWMRLLCQPLAAKANREEDQLGHFWQGRFRRIRICDEATLLACAAYVDLNPIRAALLDTLTTPMVRISRRNPPRLSTFGPA